MNSHRLIRPQELTPWCKRVFTALGTPVEKAHLVAESLVAANLRGVDSHGVHLVSYYVEHIRRGHLAVEAEGRVSTESGGCLVYDGERTFGQWVSEACCRHAVRLAREHGLSMVVARNSNHFGAAAFWGQRISDAGMAAIVMCNASPSVPPWQGQEGRVGTNPICVSMPSSGKGAWLLDMATTTVAWNKVLRARRNGEPELPNGWALDESGKPTTETASARYAMPLGGYKGSGLGLWAEIFSAVLSGGAMSTEVGGTFLYDRRMNTSHTFLAIDVSRFMDREDFQARMDHIIQLVKSAAPAEGYDEVLVAGEPEWRIESDRIKGGVPIDAGTWERFGRLDEELGVGMPG